MDEKGKYFGNLGSYCWNGVCVDCVPPQQRKDINDGLKIRKGHRIKFGVIGYKKPDKFRITIFLRETIILESDVREEIKFEIPEGEYVLAVKADWDMRGDVAYAFQIKIY